MGLSTILLSWLLNFSMCTNEIQIWTYSQLRCLLHNENFFFFFLPACRFSAEMMPDHNVFRVDTLENWRLRECNPHKSPKIVLISFCKLCPGRAPQHVVCGETVAVVGGSFFPGAIRWTLVSNNQEEWHPTSSKWKKGHSQQCFLN